MANNSYRSACMAVYANRLPGTRQGMTGPWPGPD